MGSLLRGVLLSAFCACAALSAPARGQTPAPQADAYGDPLPAGAVKRFGTVRFREGDRILALAFSGDGRLLASCTSGRVRLWDVPGGRLVREFTAARHPARVCFSPDGRLLAAFAPGPEDRSERSSRAVRIYDVATGAEIRTIAAADGAITDFTWTRDGRHLVAGTSPPGLRLYDVQTGKETRSFSPPAPAEGREALQFGAVRRVVLSDDASLAVSEFSLRDGMLAVWDLKRGTLRHQSAPQQGLCGLAVAPDNRTVLIAYSPYSQYKEKILKWDVGPGATLSEDFPPARGHTGLSVPPAMGVFSPDGKTLAYSVSVEDSGFERDRLRSGSIQLIDVATGAARPVGPKTHGTHALAFSPDGKVLASGGPNGAISLWDAATGEPMAASAEPTGPVHALAVSPDGSIVATGGEDAVIRLRDPATGKVLRTLEGHENTVTALAFSPDGRTLASRGAGEPLILWNAATGAQAAQIGARGGSSVGPAVLSWTLDGKYLGCMSAASLSVIDVVGRRITSEDLGDVKKEFARDLRFHGEESVRSARNLVNEQTEPSRGMSPSRGACAALSPDLTQIVLASDNSLEVVERGTLKTIRRLAPKLEFERRAPQLLFRHAAFTPDGSRVVAIQDTSPVNLHRWPVESAEQVIRVYDAATGEELLTLEGHRGQILSLAFARNGRLLLTGGADGTVLVWDLLGQREAPSLPSDPRALWAIVLGESADRAADAMRLLAAKPDQAVAMVREHFRTVPQDEQVEALVKRLEDARLGARLEALADLAAIRDKPPVEAILVRRLLRDDTPEALRLRILDVLRGFGEDSRHGGPDTRETPEVRVLRRAVKVLEWAGSDEAREELRRLAALLPPSRGGSAAREALERIESGATRAELLTRPPVPGTTPRPPSVPAPAAPVAPPAPVTEPAPLPPRPTTPPAAAGPLPPPLTPEERARTLAGPAPAAPLPPGAKALFAAWSLRHGGDILSLAFSPDGRFLASAGEDQRVRLWDLSDGRQVAAFPCSGESPAVRFSPDGRLLAFIGPGAQTYVDRPHRDGRTISSLVTVTPLRLWEVGSSKPPESVEGVSLACLAFSPDGKLLAAGGAGIDVWQIPGRQKLGSLGEQEDVRFHGGAVTGLLFSNDGTRLVSLRDRGGPSAPANTMTVWDLAARKAVTETKPAEENAITGLGFTPDGRTLLTTHTRGLLGRWDAQKWGRTDVDVSTNFSGQGRYMRLGVFSPDARCVAVEDAAAGMRYPGSRRASSLLLLDAATGRTLQHYGTLDDVAAVAFSADGRMIAAGGKDHVVMVWETASAEALGAAGPGGRATALAVSPDGARLAIGSSDGTVSLRQADDRKELSRLQGHAQAVTGLAFSSDGRLLASGARDRTLRVWDAAAGRCRSEIKADIPEFHDVVMAFSPDGRLLAAGGYEKGGVWDALSGDLLWTMPAPRQQGFTGLLFSPDGKRLTALQRSGFRIHETVQWNQVGGNLTGLFGSSSHETRGGRALSPNGRLFADGTDVWDTAGCLHLVSLVRRSDGPAEEPGPDGPGRPPRRRPTAPSDQRAVRAIAFSPDSARLALAEDILPEPEPGRPAARGDLPYVQIVHVWDLDSLEEVATFQGHDGPVRAMAFSPSGALLYTASDDAAVLAWGLSAKVAHAPPAMGPPDEVWAALLDREDLTKAYRAIQALAANPAKAIEMVHRSCGKLSDEEDAEVLALIRQLDDASDQKRSEAAGKLGDIQSNRSGAERGLLRAALDPGTSARVKDEAKKVMSSFSPRPYGEGLRMVRVIAALERAGTPDAKKMLQVLADRLAPRRGGDAAKTSLERLGAATASPSAR